MGNIIFKKDIAIWLKSLNKEISLTKVEQIVDIFFKEISTALMCGDRIELRELGFMVVKKRAARIAKNPRTDHKDRSW